MNYKESDIRPEQIDFADTTLRITTETDMGGLVASVRALGLLHRPLLVPKEDAEAFTVVSGFRRTAACCEMGLRQIPAKIATADCLVSDLARHAVADNATQRPLNPIEVSRSLALLSEFFPNEADLSKEAELLGLPSAPPMIRKITRLCHMPDTVQNGLLSGVIPMPAALLLDELGNQAADAFARLFIELRLGLNKQREIISLAREIAIREDASVTDVLMEDGMRDILDIGDIDRNQKTARIRQYLKERRFPNISRFKKEFAENVEKLGLGGGIKLSPPPDFESPVYTLALTFRDIGELDRLSKTVESVMRHPAMKQILDRS